MNSENAKLNESPKGKDCKKNIEVWEDVVRIKDLVIALVICSATAFGGYIVAPNKPPKPLLFGLLGAIIGFVICSIIIKPKRIFIETNQED
ncbi:hypothetical protein [Desnuesiella massiliensis]|uniref:hypothetical protein n=1 Tax=Desnuesiella massiliensis TaxID=1650662 RepID=UPI0006E284D7|nr:hypothetical protein [Desnuesiella massiliensis]